MSRLWPLLGVLLSLTLAFLLMTLFSRRLRKDGGSRRWSRPVDNGSGEPVLQFALLRAQESRSSQDGTP